MSENKVFTYGMRLRPFSIGCQPMDGLIKAEDGRRINGHYYWNILKYNRELSESEMYSYDLDPIQESAD